MEVSTLNEKVFYRFVEFTSRLVNCDLTHEDLKLLALGKKEALTKTEKHVKRLSDAFLYLLSSINQIVDDELVITCYYLLTKKRMPKDTTRKILEHAYLNMDMPPHNRATLMILFINKLKIRRKLEFSLLLCNLILIKAGYSSVIVYQAGKAKLRNNIKANDFDALYEDIIRYEHQTRKSIGSHERVSDKKSLNEIINVFKKLKAEIVSDYCVEHLFLYGSVVKVTNHLYSDIDLLVVLNGDLVNYERYEKIKNLKDYLEIKMGNKVDVLEFGYSLEHLEIKEMNNTIKIF